MQSARAGRSADQLRDSVPGLGMLEGLCVPLMGMHAMPAAEIEQTEPFGASMIVGYSGRDFIFIEPIIAQAELLKRQSFDLETPEAPGAPDGTHTLLPVYGISR